MSILSPALHMTGYLLCGSRMASFLADIMLHKLMVTERFYWKILKACWLKLGISGREPVAFESTISHRRVDFQSYQGSPLG